MKLIKGLLFFLIFQNLGSIVFGQAGQQNLVYNHYFINPSLYNPSYIATDGYAELYLNYRTQWAGFEGAPKTGTLNLQLPLSYKSGFGINLYNDQAGILETNTGLLSFAYQIYLGKRITDIHKLGFGLSAGVTNSKIDFTNANEPLANSKSNTSNIDGQFGLNYQFKNFKLSFALPRIFKSKLVSDKSYNNPGLEPLQSAIATGSYKFTLSPRTSFEPFVLYRIDQELPSQLELLGVLKIDNLIWLGGAYRQDYGSSAFIGFNLKEKIKIGYAYEFAPNKIQGVRNGSHEIQLILRLSKHKKERPKQNGEKEQLSDVESQNLPDAIDTTETIEAEVIEAQPKQEPIYKEEPVVQQPLPENTAPVISQTQSQPAQTKQEVSLTPVETKKLVSKTLEGVELKPGNYVVVGAFELVSNAKNYKTTLRKAGYPADVAFNPEKNYYIVHMGVTATLDEARRLRDVYRQKSRYSFRDTWILIID